MSFISFDIYHDVDSGITANAAYFGKGIAPKTPDRYVFFGTWQASQSNSLPFVKDEKVFRVLRDKIVEQPKLTKLLQSVLTKKQN